MPLTIRTKDSVVATMQDSLLAGDIVTDFNNISATRQLIEGLAATVVDLTYDLWTLQQGFYRDTATDTDLDLRGQDMRVSRDPGQAASGTVTYTRDPAWIDDIVLAAQQSVEAALSDGTVVSYRTLEAAILEPQGRSVSGTAPATTLTGGTNDQIRVNLNGDGAQTITLGTQTTGAGIASAIQTAVRALTAVTPGNQPAFTTFRCDYNTTTVGAYTLRSGTTGPTSSVVVTAAVSHNGTVVLKLGTANGGQERGGEDTQDVAILAEQIGLSGNVGAGQITTALTATPGVLSLANALPLTNGQEPASDDAYRQDILDAMLSRERGTLRALTRAVYQTRGADGQRHVLSAQLVAGVGVVQVWVADGRSLLTGAQPDVLEAVSAELYGEGETLGGQLPAGVTAGVIPATIYPVVVTATVTVGPTPDLLLAQQAITAAVYELLYTWPIGTPLTYMQMTQVIDQTVSEMLGVLYTDPPAFSPSGSQTLEAVIGRKLMPSTLAIEVQRAI